MMRALLHRLVRHLPEPRVIYDRAGGSPYLSRWYLLDRFREGKGIAIFLHRFHRGDDDQELHNHPWVWSVSFILAGGYREERRLRGWAKRFVHVREVRPWSFNVIRGDDFHRVDLYEEDAWRAQARRPRLGGVVNVAETLAGLAFLGRYAPEPLRPYIHACLDRIQDDIRDAKILSARQRSVDDLEISARLANILQAASCKTVEDALHALRHRDVLWRHARKAQRELYAVLRELLGDAAVAAP